MESDSGQAYDVAHTLWTDRGYLRHASAYLLCAMCCALLLILLVYPLPLVDVKASDASVAPPSTRICFSDGYPLPRPTAPGPYPTSADDTAYPGPTDAAPSATPTHTDIPSEPSPQTEQMTSTPYAEETYPPEETPIEPTIASPEPTSEGESDTPTEAIPTEEESLDETEPTLTPTPDRHVRALPTVVGPSPTKSPAQAQGPLIPQELFTCSVVLLVLVTILLGLHLARSEQSGS